MRMKSMMISLGLIGAISLGGISAPRTANAGVGVLIMGGGMVYHDLAGYKPSYQGGGFLIMLLGAGAAAGSYFVGPFSCPGLMFMALDAENVSSDNFISTYQNTFPFIDDAGVLANLADMTVTKYREAEKGADGRAVVQFTREELEDVTGALDLSEQEFETLYNRLK